MTHYKPAPPWTRADMREELSAGLSAITKGESSDDVIETLMMSLDRYVQDERERIAQAIEADRDDCAKLGFHIDHLAGMSRAARIARAES